MSACISIHGEFSSHEFDGDDYTCTLCLVFDEDAAMEEIKRLRAERATEEPDWEYEATPDWIEGIRWTGRSLENHLANIERFSDPNGGWWYADKENKPETITYQVRKRKKSGPWVPVEKEST